MFFGIRQGKRLQGMSFLHKIPIAGCYVDLSIGIARNLGNLFFRLQSETVSPRNQL